MNWISLLSGTGWADAACFTIATVAFVSLLSVVTAWTLRKRSAIKHGVLLSAMAACLLAPWVGLISGWIQTPIVAVPVSIWTDAVRPDAPLSNLVDAADDSLSDVQRIASFPSPVAQADVNRALLASTVTQTPPIEASQRDRIVVSRLPTLPMSAAMTWLAGTLCLLLFGFRSHHRGRQVRRRAVICQTKRIQDLALVAKTRTELPSLPSIVLSKEIAAPIVHGCREPIVILPVGMMELISDDELTDVLVHEFAHIHRRDTLVVAAEMVTRAIFWPVMTVHWMIRDLGRAREEVCDNYVLAARDPVTYAETLLKIAQIPMEKAAAIPAVGILHWHGVFEKRIESLLDGKRNRTRSLSSASAFLLLAIFAAGCVALTGTRLVATELPTVSEPLGTNQAVASKQKPASSLHLIVQDDDGVPIKGAEIQVMQWRLEYTALEISATTDASGEAELSGLPVDSHFYVIVKQDGYAIGIRSFEFSTASHRETTVTLSPPIDAWIQIVSLDGKPVKDAEIMTVRYVDSNGELNAMTPRSAKSIDIDLKPSNAQGRLYLPPLPKGSKIESVRVIHPNWKANRVSRLVATNGRLASLTLEPGVPMTIQLLSVDSSYPIPDGTPVHVSANTILGGGGFRHPFKVKNGKLTFTVEPTNYQSFKLSADDHYIGNLAINLPDAPYSDFDLRSSEPKSLSMRTRKKVKVHGRVIDGNGRGLAGAYVRVFVIPPNRLQQADEAWKDTTLPANQHALRSSFVALNSAETDANGFYEIELTDGVASIVVTLDGYRTDTENVRFSVDESSSTTFPDISMHTPNPQHEVSVIRGVVQSSDGTPAAGMIVQLRKKKNHGSEPVGITKEDGSYELRMKVNPEYEDLSNTEDIILAFSPNSDLAGFAKVDYADPSAMMSLSIDLAPRSREWILDPTEKAVKGDGSPRNQEDLQQFEFRLQQRGEYSNGNIGLPVPSMNEGTWLNTNARSLDEFYGRFVLLDFWFIGCGPCHRQFPVLEVAEQAFADDRFQLVSMHINTQTVANVKSFLKENEMTYPTVVDNVDGEIYQQFISRGVRGFPSFILIDPNGKIYHNDALGSEHHLFSQKLELIRNAIQSWDWDE